MRRINEPIGDAQCDGMVRHPFQIAAPPIAIAVIAIRAFDNDQQVGVGRKYGVARTLRSCRPVLRAVGRWTTAKRSISRPAGTGVRAVCDQVRLVAKIDRYHSRIAAGILVAGVSAHQRGPVVNPGGFGIRARIPQSIGLGAVAGFRAVIVQNYSQTKCACRADDFIHYLQRI